MASSLRTAINKTTSEVLATKPPGHEVAGFVMGAMFIPREGGLATIVVQFLAHGSIQHQAADMLRDVARALEERASQLDNPVQ